MLENAPKTIRKLSPLIGLIFLCLLPLTIIQAQSISDLEKEVSEKNQQISEKKGVLSEIEKKIAEIRGSNNTLGEKISLITEEIDTLKESIESNEKNVATKVEEIESKQVELEEKKGFLDDISAELYVESRNLIPSFFFLGEDSGNVFKRFYIKRSAISFLLDEVEKISGDFSTLADAKASLEKEMEELGKRKEELDESYALLDGEKKKLQNELNKQNSQKGVLSAEITDLSKKVSALQSALIAARSAGIVSSGGSTGSTPGTSISPAPAGSFGVFSIGAYTHRNGMSQWGAKARAEAGQSMSQILGFYYPGTTISNGLVTSNGVSQPLMQNINVNNIGSVSFEDYYLLGIKEMPETWNFEVLKAQAIAARTYAVWYVNNGNGRLVNGTLVSSICTSQSCQVFNTPLKTGAWRTAVQQTRGQILVDSRGSAIMAEYAAVHGAWVNGAGWDTRSGTGNDWFNDAWDKISGVNWFYRSWYIKGSGYSGETCGHSPYLSQEEMLLLVNGYLIKNDIGLARSADKSRLLPHDYGKCSGRLDYGRNDKSPYTLSQMQDLLANPVRSISSVNVAFGNGKTDSVVFYTNRGIVTISGAGFKDIYNQMAPGHMRIQQQPTHVFFNIEKR